ARVLRLRAGCPRRVPDLGLCGQIRRPGGDRPMRHVAVLFVAATLCLVGAGAGALVFLAGDMPGREESREIVGTDLDGNELKLSEFRGKVVLLVFWVSDQGDDPLTQTCLKRLQKRYDSAPFRVLGVNGD